jgi:hypothetical protein
MSTMTSDEAYAAGDPPGDPRRGAGATLVTDEGISSLAPAPEVIARQLRELRQTAGQHEAQLGDTVISSPRSASSCASSPGSSSWPAPDSTLRRRRRTPRTEE